jgi:hypothetical protein
MYPWFSGDEKNVCPNQPQMQHIVLRCKNHPHLTWSTKNTPYIGGRTVFFSGDWGWKPKEGQTWADKPRECDCPLEDLYHDCKDDPKEEKEK